MLLKIVWVKLTGSKQMKEVVMTRQVKAGANSTNKEASTNRLKAVEAMKKFNRIELPKGETIFDLKRKERA